MEDQKKHGDEKKRVASLRAEAEKRLARSSGAKLESEGKSHESIVYELEVHQIELEMQNEALRKTQLDLEESRDRYADLYDFAPLGYFTFTGRGVIKDVNLTGASLLGGERKKLLNRGFGRFVSEEDLPRWDRHLIDVQQNMGKQNCELMLKLGDGSIFYARLESVRMDVGNGTSVVRSIVSDISERKNSEDKLRLAHEQLELRVLERTMELNKSNKQLRNLAAHLQSIREEERMKIAREIHDELGQALTAHKMELSWFREKYGDHEVILEKVGAMLDAINATIQSVKRICTDLRPSILDDFGLVEAMQWHANEFQKKTQIECIVDSVTENIELDKERNTTLFRIFQEALTNVLKHAKATKVTARLTKDNDNITLEVIDNGKGITDEQLFKSQSFGLIGMRERVYPWGGKVEITAGYKNQGTKVKVSIPYVV